MLVGLTASSAQAATTVFVDVNVLAMAGPRVLPAHTVIVRDGASLTWFIDSGGWLTTAYVAFRTYRLATP